MCGALLACRRYKSHDEIQIVQLWRELIGSSVSLISQARPFRGGYSNSGLYTAPRHTARSQSTKKMLYLRWVGARCFDDRTGLSIPVNRSLGTLHFVNGRVTKRVGLRDIEKCCRDIRSLFVIEGKILFFFQLDRLIT